MAALLGRLTKDKKCSKNGRSNSVTRMLFVCLSSMFLLIFLHLPILNQSCAKSFTIQLATLCLHYFFLIA